jgi:hypothetical protein
MNWLFDSPFTILLASIAIGFFLGVAWVQTGRNAFLYSIGGLVAIAILLLVVERYVETDGEKVRKLIYVIAADVESNDPQRVVQHIVSTQPELRDKAASEMKNYHFDHVTIGTIHRVEELPHRQPPQVVIEFNVTVGGSFGGLSDDNFPRWVQLTFWKDTDGQWRIADYDHREPTAFMEKR